jgi:hypothetical protein
MRWPMSHACGSSRSNSSASPAMTRGAVPRGVRRLPFALVARGIRRERRLALNVLYALRACGRSWLSAEAVALRAAVPSNS